MLRATGVFFGEQVGGFGEHDGTVGGVLHGSAGGEFTTTGGNLDDAVGLGFGECAECAVDGRDRCDIDRWVGIATFLGGIQHGTVLGRCGDRHDGVSVNDPQALNKRESHEKL
jgi:hypothetical protein